MTLHPVLIDPNSQADKSETDLLLQPRLITRNCMLNIRNQIFVITPGSSTVTAY
jgi:hypothetical protein